MVKIVEPSFEIEAFDGERLLRNLERAGRTAYRSEDKITPASAKKFVKKMLKLRHESVIEHEKVTVRIICDRGVGYQIVRHRIASYTQESTRYCNYTKGRFGGHISVIEPPGMSFKQREVWFDAMREVELAYFSMIEAGASPQIARSVLPNSLKTEIVCTYNLREWRHFFKLRTAPAAHPQMRQITIPLLESMKMLIPVIFDDIPVVHEDIP